MKAVSLLVSAMLCLSCAVRQGDPGALPDVKPAERPPISSDEAGLWMAFDQNEENLKTSGRLMNDEALHTYIRDTVCRVAASYCRDIRVYIIQTPHFNASMAPNGTMQVWTGLILRAENESQLAYILGHEVAHYLRRHTLQIWRDIRMKSDLLVFFSIMAGAAGYGDTTYLASWLALASIYSFSRDQEREADDIGFELMANAGYEPREAPRIWEALINEQKAGDKPTPWIFFATHPSTSERVDRLRSLAGKATVGRPGAIEKGRFQAVTGRVRGVLLRDELRRREYAQSQVLFDRLIQSGVGLGELHYFQGELYRLRAESGDEVKAIAAYQKAIELGEAPVETYRDLGLVLSKAGEKAKARAAYTRYLQNKPNGADHELIREYVRQLE